MPPVDDSLPVLVNAMRDEDPDVRRWAAKALRAVPTKLEQILPILVRLLNDRGVQIYDASSALHWIPSGIKDAVRAMVEALKDEDYLVRRYAAEAFELVSPVDSEPGDVDLNPFTRVDESHIHYSMHGPPSRHVEALTHLGFYERLERHVLPALIRALKDADAFVRVLSIVTLHLIGRVAHTAVPALTKARADGNPVVRGLATRALARLGLPVKNVVPDLMRSLADHDPSVRGLAAEALGEWDAYEAELPGCRPVSIAPAVQALERALKDGDPWVRRLSARALGRIAWDAGSAVPGLVNALADEDAVVRGLAAGALGRVAPNTKHAIPPFIEALGDDDAFVRGLAAEALVMVEPNAEISAVHPDYSVLVAAQELTRIAAAGLLPSQNPN